MIWVLESDVFPHSHAKLRDGIVKSGHRIIDWQDDWWSGKPPRLDGSAVVFHGSLGNAARIHSSLAWNPGAFCNVPAFHCTSWYEHASQWLLNRQWRCLAAEEFVRDRERVFSELGEPDAVFVRPDSPLKPFSGRTLTPDRISLEALDYGFYYEDSRLPIIVAPARLVGREWRFVIVDRAVVAGCGYSADGRIASADDAHGPPWEFASQIAQTMPPPEDVYVLDICECDGDFRLLELNPFSGADLYDCDANDIVGAVSDVAGTKRSR